MMKKLSIVSGMRPTGRLHLGHYFGVLKNWIELQKDFDCFFFVADWHSLTTEYHNSQSIKDFVSEMALDWLASGVDPLRTTLFIQSHIPEQAELHLLFSMITPLGWLERVPSYKELKNELKDRDLNTYGFLGYPLLQTADVAIYKANKVPVGQDQVAHIELAREIIRRFHHLFKTEIFPEPESLTTPSAKIIGMDGRKMSKSYHNSIYLSDSTEERDKKIKGYITDPARKLRSDPGHPEICPIFAYHQQVTEAQMVSEIDADCRTAKIGCVDCKKILMKNMTDKLGDFSSRRALIKKKEVEEILMDGSKKARGVAAQTLGEAKTAMGLC